MGLNWCVDSWAPLDGVVFASLREPEPLHASAGAAAGIAPWLDAKTTVHISPPDWRPVSISRLATAFASARGSMQAGFWSGPNDESLEEIVFAKLDTLIEFVRRVYVAAGAGLDSSGEVEPVRVSPEPETPPRWEELLNELSELEPGADRLALAGQLSKAMDSKSLRRLVYRDLPHATSPWLRPSAHQTHRVRDHLDLAGVGDLQYIYD